MRRSLFILANACASLLVAESASAANYVFLLSGPQTASFTLDSSPVPSAFSSGEYFVLLNVDGLINGVNALFDLGFGASTYSSRFGLLDPSEGTEYIAGPGSSLYSGPEAAPTFKTGTFALSGGYNISIFGPPIPEPATWAMMVLGAGFTGMSMRRRTSANTRVTFAAPLA